jgi:hypothetical protein
MTDRRRAAALVVACSVAFVTMVAPASRVARAAVAVPDPILSIAFDEGSGATADDSAPGDNDATIGGAQWVDGQSGNGLGFGGDGDRVDIDGDGLHHQSTITIAFWVRSSGVDPTDGAVILEAGSTGCGTASFGFYATQDGLAVKPPSSGLMAWDSSFYNGIDIWDGDWHHVAATWSIWTFEHLIVDGFDLGGNAPLPSFDTEVSDDISVGASLAGAGCDTPSFRGEIDDLRVWNANLEREQIGSLLPPVQPTVTLQPGIVKPIHGGCVQVLVSPGPPAGSVRVELRDENNGLVGKSMSDNCGSLVIPPTGTYNLSIIQLETAGAMHATAFYEPSPPWLSAQSDPVVIDVPRLDVGMQLFVPNVMPGTLIQASVRLGFADTIDRQGEVELIDTTGSGETVVATADVEPMVGSSDGVATFALPGRSAGEYTFEARYEGTPDLWAPSTSSEVTVEVDDTLGTRGPITFGVSPAYWSGDVLDVYAPADHASYVEVREPGGSWFRQGYALPVIYPFDTFADTPADGPVTIDVRWEDDGGRLSEIQSKTLTLDRTDPSVASAGSPIVKTTATSGTVPVRVGWSARDTTSGVASSDVQVSVNGGSYKAVAGGTTLTRLGQRLDSGDTFRYRMRSRDKAGNVSGWSYDRTLKPKAYNERSTVLRYSGSWAYSYPSAALGDRVRRTTTAGAKASVTFTGRSYGWIATMGPTRGKAAVYVGGTKVATVDLYAPTTRYRQVVFTKTWTTSASRTVTIKALGTPGRPRIDVDGILLVR